MAKIHFNLAEYEARQAAILLAEGDPAEAIAILEGEGEVGRPLRTTLAAMLIGNDPSGARLTIEHEKGGRPSRRTRNFWRDMNLGEQVEDLLGGAQFSKSEAHRRVAKKAGLSRSTVAKAHRDYLKATQIEL